MMKTFGQNFRTARISKRIHRGSLIIGDAQKDPLSSGHPRTCSFSLRGSGLRRRKYDFSIYLVIFRCKI